MMKDKVKGLVAGVLIGTMIAGGTTYAAANVKLNVVMENVKLMFNGVHKETAKTAWIGQKEGASKYLGDLNYARMDGDSGAKGDIFFKNWKNPDGLKFNIADNQYSHGIGSILNTSSWSGDKYNSIDYNLNGKYKKLTGFFGVDDYTKNSDNTGSIIIYGDGTEIFRQDGLRGGDMPKFNAIDITGVLKLQIRFECESDKGNQLDLVIGEAKLY